MIRNLILSAIVLLVSILCITKATWSYEADTVIIHKHTELKSGFSYWEFTIKETLAGEDTVSDVKVHPMNYEKYNVGDRFTYEKKGCYAPVALLGIIGVLVGFSMGLYFILEYLEEGGEL
jgi:hypothetical protein